MNSVWFIDTDSNERTLILDSNGIFDNLRLRRIETITGEMISKPVWLLSTVRRNARFITMDLFTKILEQFGAFFRLQDQLSSLSNSNPVAAWAVILVMAMFIANIAITQVVEFKNKLFGQWRHNHLAWAGLIAGFCIAGLVSAGVVLNLKLATAAVPTFDKDLDIVIGRPLLLKWNYPNRNARFEIQSSEDPDFKVGVEKTTGDGAYFPAEHINGKRFWRVREVDAKDMAASRWSRSIAVTQYETSLKRIKETRHVRVYISNSLNEAFFKFDVRKDGKRKSKGYEIAIIEEIINKLPPLLNIKEPLSYDVTPVSWDELLHAPRGGRADIIISTITSFSERERHFSIKFSKPYYCTTQSLIYRSPQSSKSVLEMIEKKKVGVQRNTTSQEIMKKFTEEKKFELKDDYDQVKSMVDALADHLIDVGLTDTPFARSAQLDHGADKLVLKELTKANDFPKGTEPARRVEKYAIAVRDGENDLIDAINKIIVEMQKGKLVELLEKATEEFYVTKGGARNLPMFDRKADPSECKLG